MDTRRQAALRMLLTRAMMETALFDDLVKHSDNPTFIQIKIHGEQVQLEAAVNVKAILDHAVSSILNPEKRAEPVPVKRIETSPRKQEAPTVSGPTKASVLVPGATLATVLESIKRRTAPFLASDVAKEFGIRPQQAAFLLTAIEKRGDVFRIASEQVNGNPRLTWSCERPAEPLPPKQEAPVKIETPVPEQEAVRKLIIGMPTEFTRHDVARALGIESRRLAKMFVALERHNWIAFVRLSPDKHGNPVRVYQRTSRLQSEAA
jgi:predicted ArsR family transcriptional regulator